MKGKKVELAEIKTALTSFLSDEKHLVFGFEKKEDGIHHRVFRGAAKELRLFNPSFSVNGALYLRRLFQKGVKLLLLLRPCEVRAFVELTKLTQVERESIIAVSVDCFGAVSTKEEGEQDMPDDPAALKGALEASGKVRWACKVCRERRGVIGDAGIRVDKGGGLWVLPYNERGEEFLSILGGADGTCEEAFLVEGPHQEPTFQSDLKAFSKDAAKCITCMNCRDMCPVCYCVDCLFNGDEYMPKGDALLNKVYQTGSAELPQRKSVV